MTPLRFVALGVALLGRAVAQSDDDSSDAQKVYASVVVLNHGETTPHFGPLDTILTPAGAQQMFRQGTAFRNRYLNVNNKEPGPDAAPIRNISQGAINNLEVVALSQVEEWVAAGATAFFQGLYPANPASYNSEAGGMDIARNYADGSGNLTDYPLDGYQYAAVQTFSLLDSQYPTLQATVDCPARRAEIASYLRDSQDMADSYRGSYGFYQDLFSEGPLVGLMDKELADYWSAYEVYELVKYMYTHNNTVFTDLESANDTIAFLEAMAVEFETALNSPPSDDTSEEVDMLYTISGRTLAAMVERQLATNIIRNGEHSKLTVMFGSFTPLMSFFTIARLRGEEDSDSDPFSKLPEPGAAMMFELTGPSSLENMDLPDANELRVRFLYRASADEDDEFKAAALFGSSSADLGLPWSDFSRQMVNLGVDSFEWCGVCQPVNAVWCNTTNGANRPESNSPSGSDDMDPVVAGVIGAVVTLAVTALLGLALFLLCGFRLRRSGKDDNSATGGFKGAERMPDDKDVAVTKGGAQHERVGSWELRDGPGTPPGFNGAGIVTSDFHRRSEPMVDDDAISVTGARVVNTRESL